MRPRTVALIAAAGTVGMLITVGVPLLILSQLMIRPSIPRAPMVGMVQAMPNRMVLQPPAAWLQPVAAVPVSREQIKEVRGAVAGPKDVKLSQPVVHGNLGIFLIHGPDKHQGKSFLTLHEALARGQAVVHDRGMVVVENLSDTQDLFVQSGDIVKGGNQDRTIEYDQLLPPKSGPVTVAAHCVEQGRSFPRDAESAQIFLSAAEQLPTRSLRLANLHRHSQGEVWSGVQRTQADLSRSVGVSIRNPTSSLQLVLETDSVQRSLDEYFQDVVPRLEENRDVIGFAVVVNGRLQSADMYASADMFERLAPKLLRAAAIQALAERRGQARFEMPTAADVKAFLADPAGASVTRRDVSSQVCMVSQESAQGVVYDTCDRGRQNLVVHRCVLAK